MLRKVISFVLQVLGQVGLPTDLKLWWNGVIPAIASAVPGAFALAQNASWWMVALITLGAFVALFLVSIPAERGYRRFRARSRQEQVDIQEPKPVPDVNMGDHSQYMSNSPGGQQAFGDIINEGPQPRDISREASNELVRELRKHEPERFQISSMQDAESGELGAMLRDVLQQGGWQMVAESSGMMLPGGPPRGVILETTTDSRAVDTLVSWLGQVKLNPRVNREEHEFGVVARGFGNSPPAPVHVVVGVLPR